MAEMTLVEAVTMALAKAMEEDETVLVLGEDVGPNGGVFRATDGLHERFGGERVFDTPLAEGVIAGVSVGLAAQGFKPVAEIQFLGFLYPAIDQIISHASRLRNRTRGRLTCPMVVRAPYGGGIHGPEHHSESTEAMLAHIPGLRVVIPSTPSQAYGLLLAAIRDPDPVMFLEPKRIYRTSKDEVPEGEHVVPLSRGRIAREGTDCTVVAYGSMVGICQAAADEAAENGKSIEIIDPRTLVPLDEDIILDSVKKTGRCVVVYEAPKTCGYGAEIAALVAEQAIEYMEGPIVRVAGFDTPFPYALENLYMPDLRRIMKGIQKTFSW
jgi:2-oxoisovalerate dehydrogenase E1 component beta subunit